jgi:hypothetical protein
MGRMRRALQQRLPVLAGTATLTVFLAAAILLPKTTSEVLRDSAFDIELAGDQWLRGPAPSDLKVIVVDIDRASIDALGTRPCRRRRWRGSSRRWRPGGTLTRPRHGNCSAIVGPGATASCDLTTFLRRVVSLASRSALHADRRIPDGHGARPVSRRRGCRGLHPKQTAEYGRPA